jgi:AraC-like DNA-binding protein
LHEKLAGCQKEFLAMRRRRLATQYIHIPTRQYGAREIFCKHDSARRSRFRNCAAASHLSRFHLVRSFTQRVGLPPHAYQIHVRIERARELLRKGMHSGQVACLVGFSDQSHFTRHFKKIMRVTPSKYVRGVAARKSYPSALASSSNIVWLSFSGPRRRSLAFGSSPLLYLIQGKFDDACRTNPD